MRGGKLSAKMNGKNVVLKNENDGTTTVTIADLNQKNGYIHGIDPLFYQNN